MSSIKEHWFDVQEQEKHEWIRQHLYEEDADEETEGWEDLANEYDLLQESLREKAEFEAELGWYDETSYSELHEHFLNEIHDLKVILDSKINILHQEAMYKMIYAHSVALLESFLGDTLKTLISSNEAIFENAINKIEELTKAKFELKDIAKQKDGAKGLAIKELSKVLYHNIPKVKRLYECSLDQNLNIDISEIDKITKIRHDIVHRNGKSIDGKLVFLDAEIVNQTISQIKEFASSLQLAINQKTNS